ncbi:MAG: hypothetical protein AB4372_01530 [Xenococcus sp. (in: cyanobacteria)]
MTSLTPASLREHIKRAIGDYIGTYTYLSNNAVVDAIAVGNPPNDIKVTGIEVILPNYPNVPSSYQGGTAIHSVEHWEVVLINHNDTKANFFLAIRGMFDYFPRKRGYDVPQSSITESLPQYNFTIIYGRGYDLV